MTVPARFHGTCSECESPIRLGDPIKRLDDGEGWVHASCDTEQADPEPCPICWLTSCDHGRDEAENARLSETVARVEAQVRHDERGEVQTRLDDLLGFLSDDGRYGYHQHPQEVCGPDHHVCALVSHLMNAVIDPDWLSKLTAAKERASRAALTGPTEGDEPA